MSPRTVSDPLLQDAPLLHVGDTVGHAVRKLLETDLPALPVVDERERLHGIFGEREFLAAVFPGYLDILKYAGFVKRSLEDALEKRRECRSEPVAKWVSTETSTSGPTSPTRRWRRSSCTTGCWSFR